MATKRLRNGRLHYKICKKGLLPKPIYFSFSQEDEAEGDAYCANLEALLARGVVPDEFRQPVKKNARLRLLTDAIDEAIAAGCLAATDRANLGVLAPRLGKVALNAVSYQWVENWVAEMKHSYCLAPSTIRHHVGAMARCFDLLVKRKEMAANPFRSLPKRYATYTEADVKQLPAGKTARHELERDRRLEANEEKAIREVLGMVDQRENKLQLKYQAALELTFELALETAMRLSEIFTLSRAQIDLTKATIFLDKTKNGSKRQVPMTSIAIAAYKRYCEHVLAGTRGMQGARCVAGLLFPWWDGCIDPNGKRNAESMNRTTAKLSAQFARIFATAGAPDFRFHDLRHEATSRFFERTDLRELEIAKITGHKSPAMLARYANLRGSAFAGRLW